MATIDNPRAIRVKTSTGWADLVIQGPPGSEGPIGPEGPPGPGAVNTVDMFANGPPANPIDGQIWNALLEDGVMWTFRYRASAPGGNKWEFVGGPPKSITQQGYGATQGGIWTPFNGLAWSVPWPGDYIVSGDWSAYGPPASYLGAIMANYGGGYNNPAITWQTTTGGNWYFTIHVGPQVFAGDKLTTFALSYYLGAVASIFYGLNLTIIPKRVLVS